MYLIDCQKSVLYTCTLLGVVGTGDFYALIGLQYFYVATTKPPV